MSDHLWPVGADDPRPEDTKRHTFVYLVCSPQGRVGKTLTARLLVDYYLSSDRFPLAFETNHFEPGLAPVFPAETNVVDFTATTGQMALFDRLVVPDGVPKVVDLWHVSYEPFFRMAQEFEFFEEAWRRGIEPVVVLLTDERQRFSQEVKSLAAQWRGVKIVLVHDEGLTRLPHESVFGKPFRLAHPIMVLPELDVVVRRALDQPKILLDRIIREPSPEVSFVIASRVRALLAPFFDHVESLERKLVLENASFLG
jgi:hypothetical protein